MGRVFVADYWAPHVNWSSLAARLGDTRSLQEHLVVDLWLGGSWQIPTGMQDDGSRI
jgi:hypothetical protein